jgi:hypothetical protein
MIPQLVQTMRGPNVGSADPDDGIDQQAGATHVLSG